jgi:hypothetical protein
MKENNYDPLSSISWQLKRIADVLESIDQRQRSQENPKPIPEISKLRQMLNQS